MKLAKVGIYARVSTLDKGQDTEVQLSDLRTYANARGWKIFNEYIDAGQSGSKEHRPAFNQLMEESRMSKVRFVFGRDMTTEWYTLKKLLQDWFSSKDQDNLFETI
jgi:DNA invertase Pin-like site-specific DNA recombinase